MHGHLKLLVLNLLSKGPKSGYVLMNDLKISTGKKPSPGSIYPLLDDLKNKGVLSVEVEGKSKIYSLTKKGKSVQEGFAQHKDEMKSQVRKMIGLYASISDNEEIERMHRFFDDACPDKLSSQDIHTEMLDMHETIFTVLSKAKDDTERKALTEKVLKALGKTIAELKKIK
jgi:formylmethanofuran dehydrogenase subunit E